MKQDVKKVIIDFDDTLFYTYHLKNVLCETAGYFGFSKEEFWFTYKQTRDCSSGLLNYTFARHAHYLHALHPAFTTPRALEDAFEDVLGRQNFVLPDARDLLDFLKNQKKTLLLLSLGESTFQRKKVEHSGLARFFDRIEFVDTHKLNAIPALVGRDEPVYFLNDKPIETKEILAHYPHWHAVLRERTDLLPIYYKESGLPCFQNLTDIRAYLAAHQ